MNKMTKEQREQRKAKRPELGSWHTITNHALKDRNHWQVNWLKFRCSPCKAMYIGWRTKFNGDIETEDNGDVAWSDSNYFVYKESVEIWLFVVHPRHNPIEVFPFEIHKEATNE